MKILVTGARGLLGRRICQDLGVEAIGTDRIDDGDGPIYSNGPFDQNDLGDATYTVADLTDRIECRLLIDRIRPDAVINCAAFTHVNRAESQPLQAQAVNVLAVKYLADVCSWHNIPLIHISTNYVFGGIDDGRRTPWLETDPLCPVGVYATTKCEGELAAAEYEKSLIIRTAALFGSPDDPFRDFVHAIMNAARDITRPLRVVGDQFITPSYVPDVARAVTFLTRAIVMGEIYLDDLEISPTPCNDPVEAPYQFTRPYRLLHVTNRGETSWHHFAEDILWHAKMRRTVQEITSKELTSTTPRPLYAVLDTSAYHRLGGPEMPEWKKALALRFPDEDLEY